MRSARMQGVSTVHVVARLAEAGHGDLFLTDGRSLGRHVRSRFDLAMLSRLSQAAAAGDEPAGLALHPLLFPGAIGAALRGSSPQLLNLQLDTVLDGLHWELAVDRGQRLGERWRVTRHLLDDEAPGTGAVAGGAPRRGPLRVLRLTADEALPGADPGSNFPALAQEAVHVHAMPSSALTAASAAGLLASHDLVRLDDEVSPELLMDTGWLRPPKLFIVAGQPGPRLLALANRLTGLGAWLLLAPTLGDAPWLTALCDQLAQGEPLAEAVRRARADAPWLRLYGDGDSPLVLPDVRASTPKDARQVTSLSFDFVDSTGWLQRLGSERYASLLADFHQRCIAQVERHGGAADDPQGDDGVMSYFGYPSASERSAEQAVAAGLALVQAVAGMAMPVQVRVGIATGRVAVMGGQPVGVSIHLAARLQSAASPGTVLVSQETQALVAHRYAMQGLEGTLTLKGIEGAQRAARVLHDRSGHRLDALPRLTPFVGREVELAALLKQWEDLPAGGPRVVQLQGEAGIGKSRLVREFRQWLAVRGGESFECRCLPDHAGSAFHAVIDGMRHWLGLRDEDDAATQRRRIAEALPPGMPEGAASVVAVLLSVPGEAPPGTPERLRERTLATLVDWFRRAAARAPVCLVVEDLHWVDPSTREFLTRLVAEGTPVPLMLLLTQRPGSDTPGADWRPGRVHQVLELQGLRADEARRLVKRACGDALPAGVVRLLAGRADGVPLFLEESVRMALEQGAAGEGSVEVDALQVPGSLQDLLMARLDRLGPARAIAQFGAVLGREFPVALLQQVLAHGGQAVTAQELSSQLDVVEHSGLLGSTGSGSERRCAFKHALVRDIAYQSLWAGDRERVHQAVAAVLRASWPELTARQPELLAHHQTEAGLTTEALQQWEVAARLAASRSAHDEAIQHLQRALALLERVPEGRERTGTELRLQLLLASRFIATEGYGAERVERAYARAEQLGQALADPVASLKAQLGLEGWHFMRADFARAHEIAGRAAAMAEQVGDPMARLQVNWAIANILFHEGHAVAAVQRMDDCLAAYRPEHHRRAAVQDPGVMCLCYSAWGQWELGYPDDALVRIARVLDLSRSLDHKFSLGEAWGFAANVHRYRGEHGQALACADAAVSICEEGGFAVWLAHAHVMRGWLLCQRDGPAEGVADGLAEMREGLAMWQRSGAVVTSPLYLSLLAEGLVRSGDLDGGIARLDEALAVAQGHGERYYEAELMRLQAEMRWQRDGEGSAGAQRAAEQGLLAAHALAMQQHKRGFALRSASSLARLWQRQGRAREALALLKPQLAWFTEGQQTQDLREARRLLQAMS